MQAFKGKAAVVTGGAQGIGRALALMLKKNGVNVFVGDVRDPPKEEKIPFARCDMRKFDQIQGLMKCAEDEFGPISLWINNAGVEFESGLGRPFGKKMIEDDKRELLKDIVDINLTSVIDGTRVAVKHMQGHEQGVLSSTWRNYSCTGPVLAYNYNVHRSCALSLGDESMIRLLGMCPYFVTTPLLTTKPKVLEGLKMVGATMMEPEDIAAAMEELVYMKKDGSISRKVPDWPRGIGM